MTREEYVKTLEKYVAEKVVDDKQDNYYDGYFDGLKCAADLAEKLDEPKKVVIPEFIANDIKYHKKCGYTLLGALGSAFDQGLESDVYCWFFADDGSVKKYINAWNNGYEVEKEKKYRVKLPGLIGSNGQQYISKSMEDKLFACAYRDYLEQEFTKEELEEFPNWVQQLEFEEVEDE
ncbi:DUF1642 domain-containing protein [Pediococcus pentosaceus]|uniref:DUF1642 domain-containing protein n=1 Tax=Pediococcus pentosaceus TaxID=1255 RepID=UPI003F24976A